MAGLGALRGNAVRRLKRPFSHEDIIQRLVLAGCLVLGGCRSASERCGQIALGSVLNEGYEAHQRRIEAELQSHPDYPSKFGQDTALERMRRETRVRIGGDTAQLQPQPPPRPSDLAWYAENCYEGKPR